MLTLNGPATAGHRTGTATMRTPRMKNVFAISTGVIAKGARAFRPMQHMNHPTPTNEVDQGKGGQRGSANLDL
eukprot:94396-Pyramimonas_sp.AAC.2